jgi:hypothetical protein
MIEVAQLAMLIAAGDAGLLQEALAAGAAAAIAGAARRLPSASTSFQPVSLQIEQL